MADELALNLAAERGARAEALLRDELLAEAFENLEREYIAFWKGTGARDTDARERVWMALGILEKVRGHLHTVVADGSLAQRELNDLR